MSQPMWPHGGYGPGSAPGGQAGNQPAQYPGQQPAQYPGQQPARYPGHHPAGRPPVTLPAAVAYEAVGGTPFGVAIVGVAPTPSGPATASLIAGIASILVSFVVGCFGVYGANAGWGPVVAGAFAVLAGFLGVGALLLGRVGLGQIRRRVGWSVVSGRGLAISGMICGAVGLTLTVVSVVLAVVLATG